MSRKQQEISMSEEKESLIAINFHVRHFAWTDHEAEKVIEKALNQRLKETSKNA